MSLPDGTAGPPVLGASDGYSGIAPRGSSGFIAIGSGECNQTGTCVDTLVTIG